MARQVTDMAPMSWCTCRICTTMNAKGCYILTTTKRSHTLRYPPLPPNKAKKAKSKTRSAAASAPLPTPNAAATLVVAVAVDVGPAVAAFASTAAPPEETERSSEQQHRARPDFEEDEPEEDNEWVVVTAATLASDGLSDEHDWDPMDYDGPSVADDAPNEELMVVDNDVLEPFAPEDPTDMNEEVLEPYTPDVIEHPHDLPPLPPFSPNSSSNSSRNEFSYEEDSLWRAVLLVVSCINLRFHLPHRGCNLLLAFFKLLFSHLGIISAADKPASTLKTAFRQLGLEDRFEILPMCPGCRRIFPSDSEPDMQCKHCSIALFKSREHIKNDFDGSLEGQQYLSDVPVLKYPYRSLTSQLKDLLARPGMEDALDSWRYKERRNGELVDIMDGKVWKELKGADGELFFDNSPDRIASDTLCIGLTLGFDGFGSERGRNGPSYSSGVISHCIANLPVHMKRVLVYQPRNLFLTGIVPGPKEPSTDELQWVLKIDVDKKKRLYEEGILVETPRFPQGRLCFVACVGFCCDHPTVCRTCGHADHAHKLNFCPRCKAKRDELRSPKGMTDDFPKRTKDEHICLGEEYLNTPVKERDAFFKRKGVRYFEHSRLPYIDPIRMAILDPMHNILLGICKSHWLDSWILKNVLRKRTAKKRRELDRIHEYLRKFEMPAWVGRLPRQVGYPAGGSLSADEYKALVLVYCPLVIPLIWKEFQPAAQAEYDRKYRLYEQLEYERIQLLATDEATDADEVPYTEPVVRMHRDDSDNFLKLAASLKIILGRTIKTRELPRAKRLATKFLQGYLKLHRSDVKPNHHYFTHIFDQIRDYGPVYGFWSFTNERLNKVLKSYRTNNHNGGEIETSFFRAFFKDLRSLAKTGTSLAKETAALFSTPDNDARGTVSSIAFMADEVDTLMEECSKKFSIGPGIRQRLDPELEQGLLEHYQETEPEAAVKSRSDELTNESNVLSPFAKHHTFLILDGRRIVPSIKASNAPNSIVQMEFQGQLFVGQVVRILTHIQSRVRRPRTFFHVYWFREDLMIDTSPWDPYPELEVKFWVYNDYLRSAEEGPPSLIPPYLVKSQACRLAIRMPQIPTIATDPDEGEDDEQEDGDFRNTEDVSISGESERPDEEDSVDMDEEEADGLVWATVGLSRDSVVV